MWPGKVDASTRPYVGETRSPRTDTSPYNSQRAQVGRSAYHGPYPVSGLSVLKTGTGRTKGRVWEVLDEGAGNVSLGPYWLTATGGSGPVPARDPPQRSGDVSLTWSTRSRVWGPGTCEYTSRYWGSLGRRGCRGPKGKRDQVHFCFGKTRELESCRRFGTVTVFLES